MGPEVFEGLRIARTSAGRGGGRMASRRPTTDQPMARGRHWHGWLEGRFLRCRTVGDMARLLRCTHGGLQEVAGSMNPLSPLLVATEVTVGRRRCDILALVPRYRRLLHFEIKTSRLNLFSSQRYVRWMRQGYYGQIRDTHRALSETLIARGAPCYGGPVTVDSYMLAVHRGLRESVLLPVLRSLIRPHSI